MIAVAAIVSFLPARAQDAIAATAASSGQSSATEVPSGTERDIITVFESPSSTVTVEVPGALGERLENRVLHPSGEPAGENSDADPDTDNDQDADRPAQISKGKTVGYRVQIYTDQNVRTGKSEARTRERIVGGAFPQYSTYVSYSSPYWRLRVGDFRSQQEANKAAAEIKRAFPRFARDIRVVRDRINAR